MKFEDISNFEDLNQFIFDKQTGQICHYTSFESLIMILKNKSLRLSRYDLMNDIAEKELSKCTDGDCRYIISFTGTKKEYVAMWALYGKHSSLKLRMDFNRQSILKTVNGNFYFDSEKKQRINYGIESVPSDFTKKRFTLSDVVYYDRQKNRFKCYDKPLRMIEVNQERISRLAGTIKYDAWDYERESRLAVVLHKNQTDITDFQQLTHIYAGLSDEFIKGLTITYSPWINNTTFEVLKSAIDSLAGVPLTHKRSSLQGEITEL